MVWVQNAIGIEEVVEIQGVSTGDCSIMWSSLYEGTLELCMLMVEGSIWLGRFLWRVPSVATIVGLLSLDKAEAFTIHLPLSLGMLKVEGDWSRLQ